MNAKSEQGQPVAQGAYLPAKRYGNMIFTSGMTPRKDGVLLYAGPVRSAIPLENYRDAVVLACSNALAAARNTLTTHEQVAALLSMTVYIAAEDDFTAHSALADFASQYLESELGSVGIGCRAAVGVATLPKDASVEIQLIAAVEERK